VFSHDPGDDFDLAAGFLVPAPDPSLERNFYPTSSCRRP
jgi:hypothetical protein